MFKYLRLDLDYDIPAESREYVDKEKTRPVPYASYTFALIRTAFQSNHQAGMAAEEARMYRSVMRSLEKRMQDKIPMVPLGESEFDLVYKEVYMAKLPIAMAYLVPVLLDELDTVKHATHAILQERAETYNALVQTLKGSQQKQEEVKANV